MVLVLNHAQYTATSPGSHSAAPPPPPNSSSRPILVNPTGSGEKAPGKDDSIVDPENTVFLRGLSWTITVVVLLNALQMGLCTRSTNQPLKGDEHIACEVSMQCFTAIFFVEFLLKFYCLRWAYFKNNWNRFDFFLVVISVGVNWFISPIFGPRTGLGDYASRALRMLRVLQVLRIFQARQEFAVLTEGLVAAMRSMIWVTMLLCLVIYITALICVPMYGDIQSDYDLKFDTVIHAMLSLFTVAILADWTGIIMPVVHVNALAALFFIGFVVLTSLGLLNLVIGVITERTAAVQKRFEREAEYQQDCLRMKSIRELADLMFVDGRANVSLEGLHRCLSGEETQEKVQLIMEGVDLPLGYTIADLHTMFDRDASGHVNRQEFVDGMSRMIFCNDFQRNCLVQSSLAEIRLHIKAMGEAITQQFQAEIAELKAQMHHPSGRSPGCWGEGLAAFSQREDPTAGRPTKAEAGSSSSTAPGPAQWRGGGDGGGGGNAAAAAQRLAELGIGLPEAKQHEEAWHTRPAVEAGLAGVQPGGLRAFSFGPKAASDLEGGSNQSSEGLKEQVAALLDPCSLRTYINRVDELIGRERSAVASPMPVPQASRLPCPSWLNRGALGAGDHGGGGRPAPEGSSEEEGRVAAERGTPRLSGEGASSREGAAAPAPAPPGEPHAQRLGLRLPFARRQFGASGAAGHDAGTVSGGVGHPAAAGSAGESLC